MKTWAVTIVCQMKTAVRGIWFLRYIRFLDVFTFVLFIYMTFLYWSVRIRMKTVKIKIHFFTVVHPFDGTQRKYRVYFTSFQFKVSIGISKWSREEKRSFFTLSATHINQRQRRGLLFPRKRQMMFGRGKYGCYLFRSCEANISPLFFVSHQFMQIKNIWC